MRISEGWRLLTFWVFCRRLSYSALRYLLCTAFVQTPRRVLLWIALPRLRGSLLWFSAGDETLFFPIGAGWILGLSLLLALLFSRRAPTTPPLGRVPCGRIAAVISAHGDILERHHRRDAYQAQQAAENNCYENHYDR